VSYTYNDGPIPGLARAQAAYDNMTPEDVFGPDRFVCVRCEQVEVDEDTDHCEDCVEVIAEEIDEEEAEEAAAEEND